MSRLRLRTTAMSIAPGLSVQPYSAAWRTRCATRALEISFLLGMQAMLGQEPPIHLRSTTAVRRPVLAICQATSLPPVPLPRTRMSYRSGWAMASSIQCCSSHAHPKPVVVEARYYEAVFTDRYMAQFAQRPE